MHRRPKWSNDSQHFNSDRGASKKFELVKGNLSKNKIKEKFNG